MKSILPIALAVGVLVAMALAGGCAIDEMVTVDVPKQTRDHYAETLDLSVPPTVSLRQARQIREQSEDRLETKLQAVVNEHRVANEQLDTEIGDAALVEDLFSMAVNDGIDLGIPALAGVPGGGILASLLVGIGAYLAPRPGEGKRVKSAEDKGYDMGRGETLESLTRAK